MKKSLFLVVLTASILAITSGCFLFRTNSRDFDCVNVYLRNDALIFTLRAQLIGLQIEINEVFAEETVDFNDDIMGITFQKKDSTIIAVTAKEGLEEGELLFTVNNSGIRSLNSVEIKVEKVKSLPENRLKAGDEQLLEASSLDGISIIGNEVTLDSTGSLLVNCKGLSGVDGIHLEIMFDPSLLELKKEDIEILCSPLCLNIVDISEEGKATAALAFFETRDFVDDPVLKLGFKGLKEGLAEVAFGPNTKIVSISSEIPSEIHNGTVNITSTKAKLLGDFNSNGEVDLTDFITFARHYGIDLSDERYRVLYDIAPATNNYDGIWSGIYDTCIPDGKIDLLDFIIFARNYGKSIL